MKVSHRQRRGVIGGAILGLALATTGVAQETPAPTGEQVTDITPAQWRDRALGRTVYYSIAGEPFGREYYDPDGRRVVFQHVSGVCMEGEWTYYEDIRAYCYIWPESVSCFRHVTRGDETLILSVEPDGSAAPDAPQSVERIVSVPLSCGPAVTS